MTSTCTGCGLTFSSLADQKSHFQTEWHRHNLKRKVAGLPPISQDDFDARVLALTQQSTAHRGISLSCDSCKKTFHSDKAYDQHLISSKHKEREAAIAAAMSSRQPPKADQPQPDLVVGPGMTEPMTEADMEAQMQEKLRVCKERSDKLCVFCNFKSSSIKSNLKHMATVHSFFIPDIEYLKDVEGFFHYIKEKICVGHVCLWCNGKGRTFQSTEAVQGHMVDKAHCRIAYEEEDEWDEFADYYDYAGHELVEEDESELSEGWETDSGGEDEADGDKKLVLVPKPKIELEDSDNNFELCLPDGRKLGHRALRAAYKQKLRPRDQRRAVVSAILESYSRIPVDGNTMALSMSQMTRREKILARVEHQQSRNLQRFQLDTGLVYNQTGRHRYVNRTLMWN